MGAAFDNLGALYVVDQFNYRVEKFDATTGQLLTKWGSACILSLPNGIALAGGVTNACSTPSGGSLGDGQFGEPGFIAFAISDSTFQPMLLRRFFGRATPSPTLAPTVRLAMASISPKGSVPRGQSSRGIFAFTLTA